MLFITDAYAAANGGAANDGGLSMLLMFAGFGIVFYFLVWRPQDLRAKEHAKLIAGLAKGDEVVTSGGILGTVTKTSDDFITIAIAENLEIKLQKSAIAATLPKGTLKSI